MSKNTESLSNPSKESEQKKLSKELAKLGGNGVKFIKRTKGQESIGENQGNKLEQVDKLATLVPCVPYSGVVLAGNTLYVTYDVQRNKKKRTATAIQKQELRQILQKSDEYKTLQGDKELNIQFVDYDRDKGDHPDTVAIAAAAKEGHKQIYLGLAAFNNDGKRNKQQPASCACCASAIHAMNSQGYKISVSSSTPTNFPSNPNYTIPPIITDNSGLKDSYLANIMKSLSKLRQLVNSAKEEDLYVQYYSQDVIREIMQDSNIKGIEERNQRIKNTQKGLGGEYRTIKEGKSTDKDLLAKYTRFRQDLETFNNYISQATQRIPAMYSPEYKKGLESQQSDLLQQYNNWPISALEKLNVKSKEKIGSNNIEKIVKDQPAKLAGLRRDLKASSSQTVDGNARASLLIPKEDKTNKSKNKKPVNNNKELEKAYKGNKPSQQHENQLVKLKEDLTQAKNKYDIETQKQPARTTALNYAEAVKAASGKKSLFSDTTAAQSNQATGQTAANSSVNDDNILTRQNAFNNRYNKGYFYQMSDIDTIQEELIVKSYRYSNVHRSIGTLGQGTGNDAKAEEKISAMIGNARLDKAQLGTYNIGNGHWVTFAVVNDGQKKTVLYKDSFGGDVDENLKKILKKHGIEEKNIISHPSNEQGQQQGNVDCGIFALANMNIMASDLEKNGASELIANFNGRKFCSVQTAGTYRQNEYAGLYFQGTEQRIIEEHKSAHEKEAIRKRHTPGAEQIAERLKKCGFKEYTCQALNASESLSSEAKNTIAIEIATKPDSNDYIYRIKCSKDILSDSSYKEIAKALGLQENQYQLEDDALKVNPQNLPSITKAAKNYIKQIPELSKETKAERLYDRLEIANSNTSKEKVEEDFKKLAKITNEQLQNIKTDQHLKRIEKEGLVALSSDQVNYNLGESLVAVNKDKALLSRIDREATITANLDIKSIDAQKNVDPKSRNVRITGEDDHLNEHRSNMGALIEGITSGKIGKDTVIAIERKEYGENLGMQDVIKLAAVMEYNEKQKEESKKLMIPEEIIKSPIYQDAILYKTAKEHGVKIIGLEGRNLEHDKNSPSYDTNREQYMIDVINEVRNKGYNVIAHVGSSHMANLEKGLKEASAKEAKGISGIPRSLIDKANEIGASVGTYKTGNAQGNGNNVAPADSQGQPKLYNLIP